MESRIFVPGSARELGFGSGWFDGQAQPPLPRIVDNLRKLRIIPAYNVRRSLPSILSTQVRGVPNGRDRAISLLSLVTEFETYLKRLDLAPATVRSYTADVRGFLRWHQTRQREAARGRVNSRSVPRRSDFEAYRDFMVDVGGHSGATVNRRVQALRLFGRYLQEQGFDKENPAGELHGVRDSTAADRLPRVLDDDELARLIVAIRSGARRSLMRRDYAIVETMLQAGLRLNEVAALRREDLVLTPEGLKLTVRGSADDHMRQVPINETLARALREYLQVRPGEPGEGPLFVSQQGKALSARSVQRLVEAYATAAQLDGVCANSLRHTCAKRLLDEYPAQRVALLLGHRNVDSLDKYR